MIAVTIALLAGCSAVRFAPRVSSRLLWRDTEISVQSSGCNWTESVSLEWNVGAVAGGVELVPVWVVLGRVRGPRC